MTKRYPQSTPTRSQPELDQLERCDTAMLDLAGEIGAESAQYPVLIARTALERAEYPQAFPHLLMSAVSARDPSVEPGGLLAPANLAEPQWCLSPAVCYHTYVQFAGQRVE